MTYKEIYEKAANMLDRGKITLGDFNKMVEPLNSEVQSEPHWIPVTERPPQTGESVMICDAYGDICIGHRTMGGYYFPDFCEDKIKDVRAWCELPEPYREVTE